MLTENIESTRLVCLSGAFGVLSRLLATPSSESDVGLFLRADVLDHLAEYLDILGVERGEQLESLRGVLTSASPDEVALRLNVEATHLFHVGTPGPPAMPYESVWRHPGQLALGPSALAVAEVYRINGVQPSDRYSDAAPDHIARELEFVSHAARSEALAAGVGDADEAQKWAQVRCDFMDEHLVAWAPSFFQAVIEDDLSEFYSAIAEIGSALLDQPGAAAE